MKTMIVAEVWVQCPNFESTLHKLRKGEFSPEYDCTCLGVDLGGELKVGDDVIWDGTDWVKEMEE